LIRNLKEQGEQAGLSQEQIQASIAPMKSQRQILLTKLEGSGAVAQGAGAKAAGDRGVIARDVRGNIFTGDNVTYQEAPLEDDPEALREAYLHRMITCTSQLSP
jgi:hypothetical protein